MRGDDGAYDSADDESASLSLKDQVFHAKWKVRMLAFKKINQLFMSYKQSKPIVKEDLLYGDPENPFDTYGSVLEQMIKD